MVNDASFSGNAEKQPEDYKGRVTSYVIISCIVAASGGILFGYDSGIAGGVTATSSFLKRFFPSVYEKMQGNTHVSNYCRFRSEILTSFTSSLYIAGLIGTLLASKTTDRCGRRGSMLIGGALFLAGSAVGGAAVNIYMLILARMLLGLGIGFTNQSIPVYLSEMSPPKYRGALTGGFDISLSFGILVANLVNYVVLAMKLHDHGTVSSGIAYVVLVLLCAFIGGFGWSWGPLVWLVTSEIFPLEIRSAGQSIQVAVNFLSTFAVAQSVLEMICGLRAATFFFLAGWTVLMTVFVMFFLPETNGVPMDQMERVWRKHWYWKRFVSAASINS